MVLINENINVLDPKRRNIKKEKRQSVNILNVNLKLKEEAGENSGDGGQTPPE